MQAWQRWVYSYLPGRTLRQQFAENTNDEVLQWHREQIQKAVRTVSEWWHGKLMRVQLIEYRLNMSQMAIRRARSREEAGETNVIHPRPIQVHETPKWYIIRELKRSLDRQLLLTIPEFIRIAHVIDMRTSANVSDWSEVNQNELKRMEEFVQSIPDPENRTVSHILGAIGKASVCTSHCIARGGMIAARVGRLRHRPAEELIHEILDVDDEDVQ